MHRRTLRNAAALSTIILLAACGADSPSPTPTAPTPTPDPTATEDLTGTPEVMSTVVEGLEAPWGIAFTDDGSALVTERDAARVQRVTPDGGVTEVAQISEVDTTTSEGGLLDVVVHPDDDLVVYLYYTTADDNRVVRYRYDHDSLSDPEPILTGIPRSNTHNGGRMAFGPDGDLYIATGDAGQPDLSQDTDSLAGKILRVTDEGEPVDDNPFDNEVYSYGHRNVQGLAFHPESGLWASEFGADTLDELNLIEAGGNYGWPEFEGPGDGDYNDPEVTWEPADASPAGIAVVDDFVLVTALRGSRLWVVPIAGGGASGPTSYFNDEYGRLRTVEPAPDGTLWLSTSNRDGRGEPADSDDRILRLDLT